MAIEEDDDDDDDDVAEEEGGAAVRTEGVDAIDVRFKYTNLVFVKNLRNLY
jgi:hypothetical protein